MAIAYKYQTLVMVPRAYFAVFIYLVFHYNVLVPYLRTNTSIMRTLLTSQLTLLINIAVISFVRSFIFPGHDGQTSTQ